MSSTGVYKKSVFQLRAEATHRAEQSFKRAFDERELTRSRRIEMLQNRILQYEEERRMRQLQNERQAMHTLEHRIDVVEATAEQLVATRRAQLKAVEDLKRFENEQVSRVRELVRLRAEEVLEKTKQDARQLYLATHGSNDYAQSDQLNAKPPPSPSRPGAVSTTLTARTSKASTTATATATVSTAAPDTSLFSRGVVESAHESALHPPTIMDRNSIAPFLEPKEADVTSSTNIVNGNIFSSSPTGRLGKPRSHSFHGPYWREHMAKRLRDLPRRAELRNLNRD